MEGFGRQASDDDVFLYFCMLKYNASTFSLAQGVFLKNFKLDFMLGSF